MNDTTAFLLHDEITFFKKIVSLQRISATQNTLKNHSVLIFNYFT